MKNKKTIYNSDEFRKTVQCLTTAIRKYTLNLMNRDSVIVESKLKERAGIIGACMLSRSKLFE